MGGGGVTWVGINEMGWRIEAEPSCVFVAPSIVLTVVLESCAADKDGRSNIRRGNQEPKYVIKGEDKKVAMAGPGGWRGSV